MCLPPPSGYCDVSSPTLRMLRCVFPHPQDTAMCLPPPSGCCDVFPPTLRLKMMRCVLPQAQVAAQATTAKKVDQLPLPPPEEAVHAVEDAARHHPPHTVEEAAHHHPPKDVLHTVRGAAHHHHLHTHHGDCSTPHVLHRVTIPLLPGQVSPGVDDVLVVNDDQGELAVRGFSSSFISGIYDIPRRFLPQLLLSSLFYLGKQMTSVCLAPRPCPTFPSFPCPTSWLRATTCAAWSLYPPRLPCRGCPSAVSR